MKTANVLLCVLAVVFFATAAYAGILPVFYASFENDTPDTAGVTIHDDAGSLHGTLQDGLVRASAAKIGSRCWEAPGDWWPNGVKGNAATAQQVAVLPSGDSAWSFNVWWKGMDDYTEASVRWGTYDTNQHTSLWASTSPSFTNGIFTNHAAPGQGPPGPNSTNPPVAGQMSVPGGGVWHQAVGTYTGAQGTECLYIDGQLVDSISRSGYALSIVNSTSAPWRIGVGQGAGARIDDIAIWDIALTPAQVTELYNGGTGKAANQLIGEDIPEPATMALLGLAACGLGGYIRRRRTA